MLQLDSLFCCLLCVTDAYHQLTIICISVSLCYFGPMQTNFSLNPQDLTVILPTAAFLTMRYFSRKVPYMQAQDDTAFQHA